MIGVSLSALITQFIGVAIILFVLYRFVYRPVSKVMRERSAKIEAGLAAADKAREDAKLAEDKLAQEWNQAREEARQIVTDARAAATQLKEKELEETKKRVEEMLSKAQEEIDRKQSVAIADGRKQLGQLVVLATERVIQEKLDQAADAKLIEKTLQDAWASSEKT